MNDHRNKLATGILQGCGAHVVLFKRRDVRDGNPLPEIHALLYADMTAARLKAQAIADDPHLLLLQHTVGVVGKTPGDQTPPRFWTKEEGRQIVVLDREQAPNEAPYLAVFSDSDPDPAERLCTLLNALEAK